MKVPFSWLKELVDIDVTAQELEEKLFSCGFEVEELIPLDAGISKVVVGKIVEMEPQEGTHLTKCVVDCGEYGHDIRISTGAANMKLGDCVPAALDGSTLPGGIKIKARKMQGVESNGMLCSGEELGLNDDLFPGSEVYGLLILPEDSVPGTDIAPVVGLDDYIFDISITANRPDCQSVLGIAREVAAILGKPLHMPAMDYNTVCDADEPISVKVEAPDLCPRYMAHYVRNIRMSESPRWMKRHLALCGLRSISNVVDITNHTLLEMGQPMHAFDLNKVAGRSITVRRAVEGEKITTLDEKEFTLNPNNLVICDAEKPVALAGIMGGANSGMDDNTTSLLFECATFARDSVRKTSRALGQNSDSSARYEKGVDRHSPELGLARALHLIQELDCGDITTLEYDLTDGRPLERKHIVTTPAKICGVLGITVPDQTMIDILKRLEFTVDVQADGSWDVSAPLYREDVESFPDLAEEVIREYGYDHIVPTFLNTAAVTNGGLNYEQKQQLKSYALSLVDTLNGVLGDAAGSLAQTAWGIGQSLFEGITGKFGDISSMAVKMGGTLKSVFGTLKAPLAAAAKAISAGLSGGLLSMFPAIYAGFAGMIGTIGAAVEGMLAAISAALTSTLFGIPAGLVVAAAAVALGVAIAAIVSKLGGSHRSPGGSGGSGGGGSSGLDLDTPSITDGSNKLTDTIDANTAKLTEINKSLAKLVKSANALVLSDNMAVSSRVAASGTAQVAAAARSYREGEGDTNITQNIYSKAHTAADLQREARWEADKARRQRR